MNLKPLCILFLVYACLWGTATGQPSSSSELQKAEYHIQVGPNIPIPSRFAVMPVVEPHISAHPGNADHLLAAAMVVTDITRPYQSCRLSSFVSQDGGTSWQETAHDFWGYDPWTAILPDGRTTMTWLGTPEGFRHQFPLQVFTSSDGGIHWHSDPQTFRSHHGHDGTKIDALDDKFYLTTVRFNDDMSADVVLYEGDGKQPYEEVAAIGGKGKRLNFCEPAVLTDGTVMVPASHFLRDAWVQAFDAISQTLSPPFPITKTPGGAKGYMRMAADNHQNSRFKDRLYFVRATGSRQQYEGVWLNYSRDKGRTWSDDIRVDRFLREMPGKAQVASIGVNKDGIVGISWVDSREDPKQEKNDVYFIISTDGGVTFGTPIRVTEISTRPETEGNGDVARKFPGGGHYLDLACKADGAFQLIWSDSRSGIFALQTAEIRLIPKTEPGH